MPDNQTTRTKARPLARPPPTREQEITALKEHQIVFKAALMAVTAYLIQLESEDAR